MALLNAAIASPRQFCNAVATTTTTTVYTAPAASASVTSPSSTAYIKEIIISVGTPTWISIWIGTNNILYQVPISQNDVKIISLNTMLNAGSTIQVQSGANGPVVLISGVEVQ